ncbi:hypothetical protein [Vibrio campbellii]|uniref:hypothetical protein n=1 Tax=Vibrio campbellii TaxID=680 RepID=UPI00373525AF
MPTTVDHQVQPAGYCSVDKYLTLISTKWTAHIVWLLGQKEDTIPVTVNYGLTPKGKELSCVVELIVQKADDWDAE